MARGGSILEMDVLRLFHELIEDDSKLSSEARRVEESNSWVSNESELSIHASRSEEDSFYR